MVIEFFVPLRKIPSKTHQEKSITFNKLTGKPIVYEDDDLQEVRALFMSRLGEHVPKEQMTGPIRLVTKWLYHKKGLKKTTWKITKPDTDNIIKLPKDCMTKLGYWKDDGQVASEITEKFWIPGTEVGGIWFHIEEME